MWQFDNNLNWDLVIRQVYYATLDNFGKVIAGIPPIFIEVTSRVLLIGVRNNLAPTHWYFAGSVAPRINFSPSSTSQFGGLVQNGYSRKLALNKLNLIVIPEYNIYPLFLELRFAKWHEQMLLKFGSIQELWAIWAQTWHGLNRKLTRSTKDYFSPYVKQPSLVYSYENFQNLHFAEIEFGSQSSQDSFGRKYR